MITAEHIAFDSQNKSEIEFLDEVTGCELPNGCKAIKVLDPTLHLGCSIYEPKDIGNCSNRGTSYRNNSVKVVLDPSRVEEYDGDALILLAWSPTGGPLVKAVPLHILRSGGHSMMGGCYVSTCDSRFPFFYPVPIHDRQEW